MDRIHATAFHFFNVESNSLQNVEPMLQESCVDQLGCLIVHANVDMNSIQLAMSGEDPSCIPILRIGFVINPVESIPFAIPNTTNSSLQGRSFRCLLTVGLQVMASSLPSAKPSLSSIKAINNHICNMVHQIGVALGTTVTGNETVADASSSGGAAGAETTKLIPSTYDIKMILHDYRN